MFRPKYPREWLGRLDIEGIRRLVPSKAVEYDTHRKIKGILTKFGDNIYETLKNLKCLLTLEKNYGILK